MDRRVIRIGMLLSGSGFCALIYQIAWLRELRLVFGASTAASAAVLAIFMGGLGLGGALLGGVADRRSVPLRFYSTLEFGIAISAALSPLLLSLIRTLYIQTGGSYVLGMGGATVFRLALSALVLGVPTFLMGGTLPAAARAAAGRDDPARATVAILYGLNTVGAVFGAFIATFFFIEAFGTRWTLWMACLINVLVAFLARSLSREMTPDLNDDSTASKSMHQAAPSWFVLTAAGAVGFAFLLMEIVWYRMLGPLLGGSTYTFGLILSVALLGIGLGGAAYALWSPRRSPTILAFASTVALEAVFVAFPWALGDRLAVLAHTLRGLEALGFYGHVFGWSVVTSIVVLPAAFVSGIQFPMLIALLGQGSDDVGRHTGRAYAANTLGSIAGSLAGGFGALPLLGAVAAWQCVVTTLALLALAAVLLELLRGGGARRLATPALIVAAAIVLIVLPIGPTAAWRHSGIGVGRSLLDSSDANSLTLSIIETRRRIRWEQDGRESSVGLQMLSGTAFIVNGKNDGNARFDASTQVMLGLTSAIFHPAPRGAFVVGMGTGSSAGALAAVETIERVDVAELEPATLEMARRSAAVNYDAMDQSKIHVIVGDARELLLTIPRTYDLIVSEPSNPYRAGVASLYTREFYEAVKSRLGPGGIFSQWVQAYEIDGATFRTIYATLASVFPYVETWQTNDLDLLLLSSQQPFVYDADTLRRRIQIEPFRSSLLNTWNVIDLEGVFSHYAANSAFPAVATRGIGARLNTDDRTLIEFEFARTVGQDLTFTPNELRNTAFDYGMFRPQDLRGVVDWVEVEEQRMHIATLMDHKISKRELLSEPVRRRAEAFANFIDADLAAVFDEWRAQPRAPKYPLEMIVAGEAAAEAGDAGALTLADALAQYMPVDAMLIRARYLFRIGEVAPAARALADSFIELRTNPWPNSLLVERALNLAQELAKKGPETASVLLEALSGPYAVYVYEDLRMEMAVDVASNISPATAVPYIEAYEPNPIWTREFLAYREFAYRDTGHPLAKSALHDLVAFDRALSKGFSEIIGGPAQSAPR